MLHAPPLYREHPPCPALCSLVQCYWTIIGPVPEERRVVRILPDGCMDVIFDLGGGMLPAHQPETDTPPSAFLCGAMHKHTLIRKPRKAIVAGIRFRPGGISFLPTEATEFADTTIPIKDVFPALAPMSDFLAEVRPTPAVLMRTMEEHLLDRLKTSRKENTMTLTAAWRLGSFNTAKISMLARDMGVSQKTLERSFKRIVGLTPKKFARIMRLGRSVKLLAIPLPLVDTAFEAGYADQAHFTKEFRELTGVTPTRFRSAPDTVDFLQDAVLTPEYALPQKGDHL